MMMKNQINTQHSSPSLQKKKNKTENIKNKHNLSKKPKEGYATNSTQMISTEENPTKEKHRKIKRKKQLRKNNF